MVYVPSSLCVRSAALARRRLAPTSSPHPCACLQALTGLVATPCKGGRYQYTHPATGYVFELAPASPDSAGKPGWGAAPLLPAIAQPPLPCLREQGGSGLAVGSGTVVVGSNAGQGREPEGERGSSTPRGVAARLAGMQHLSL